MLMEQKGLMDAAMTGGSRAHPVIPLMGIPARLRSIIRWAMTHMLQLSMRIKRRQRVRTSSTPVKVNLGSGLCVAEGWINVDGGLHALICRWPTPVLKLAYRLTSVQRSIRFADYLVILRGHRFVHHRCDYGVPFASGSIDYIFSSHMLEHLFLEDARPLVADIFRALKPGGLVRMAVPDLDHAMRLYQAGRKEEALAFFFTPSRSGLFDRHHYMYDFDLLKRLLESVGFRQVARCAYREGAMPDLAVLDNRPEETLYVEGWK